MFKQKLPSVRVYIHYTEGAEEEAKAFKYDLENSTYNHFASPFLSRINKDYNDTFIYDEDLEVDAKIYAHVLFIDKNFFPLPLDNRVSNAIKLSFYHASNDSLRLQPIVIGVNTNVDKNELEILDRLFDNAHKYWRYAKVFPNEFQTMAYFQFNMILQSFLMGAFNLASNNSSFALDNKSQHSKAVTLDRLSDLKYRVFTSESSMHFVYKNKTDEEEARYKYYKETFEEFQSQFIYDFNDKETTTVKGYALSSAFVEKTNKNNNIKTVEVCPPLPSIGDLIIEGAHPIYVVTEENNFFDFAENKNLNVYFCPNKEWQNCKHKNFKSVKLVNSNIANRNIKDVKGIAVIDVVYADGDEHYTFTKYGVFNISEDKILLFNGKHINAKKDVAHIKVTILFDVSATTPNGNTYLSTRSTEFDILVK